MAAQPHKYSNGFAFRLNRLLDMLDLPVTGRYAYVAKVTGMGNSNSRSLFVSDRPPKKSVFLEKLSAHLSKELDRLHAVAIETNKVKTFLLLGDSEISAWLSDYSETLLENRNKVSVNFIETLPKHVEQLIRDANIQSSMFEHTQWQRLTNVLAKHCSDQQAINTNAETEVIEALVVLAKRNLL